MKLAIGIVGGVGSGKEVVGEYISKKLGLPCSQISQPLKDLCRERGLEPTRENLKEMGWTMVQKRGPAYLAEKILSSCEKGCVITGMRQMAQVEYLRNNSDLKIIAVDVPPEVRFERIKRRANKGEVKTLEEFLANEQLENSGHMCLSDIITLADYHLSNNSTLEDLYKQIDQLLPQIQGAEVDRL